ncbi:MULTISPECIES: hypothetical protein [Streptomyces]|uniref:hypothetical protein n=1 Tax=Streptomyces TaxID=1883 RepID=UPI002244E0B1|nr:hypothetical protein [Streptomyces griseolus]MCW8220080.1 hypothetical protein [Streptomyces griseolus]
MRTATAAITALSATLLLTACGGSGPEPKAETSATAAPTTTQAPAITPYMDGFAHGQERRTDPEFKSTEKAIIFDPVTGQPKANPKDDTLTVALRVASHCRDWSQQKYTDSADQDAYFEGCRAGINDSPPTES